MCACGASSHTHPPQTHNTLLLLSPFPAPLRSLCKRINASERRGEGGIVQGRCVRARARALIRPACASTPVARVCVCTQKAGEWLQQKESEVVKRLGDILPRKFRLVRQMCRPPSPPITPFPCALASSHGSRPPNPSPLLFCTLRSGLVARLSHGVLCAVDLALPVPYQPRVLLYAVAAVVTLGQSRSRSRSRSASGYWVTGPYRYI